ncbi:hypothetical protein K2173_026555 [Erythroxylum novogranatense]|uniref:Branched-chain-amino-acid aminotransferase n=1 Tax=Erythroxylum novogranatense TaxID=1862640 RepID=A0AAV8U0C3_9ROSI|nr:hypothetical protein K2173_026555 [Erythroxylum novogranatense]
MGQLLQATNLNKLCFTKNLTNLHPFSSLKLWDRLSFTQFLPRAITCSTVKSKATLFNDSGDLSELANVNWDDLGFELVPTDYVYVMKCSRGQRFSEGELQPYSEIELNPCSTVLNYGQGIIEGLKACRKEDNSILLFRPEKNGMRMRMGADRICMPAPTIDQFVKAVKFTVSANRRWVPPPNKGFLYIRPLLVGSGAVLSLTPPSDFIFMIYVTPIKNYCQVGLKPLNLVVDDEVHRAVPGGVGEVKAIGNYASIMRALRAAKENGFDDVLFLDSVHNRYLEEVSTANIFLVKGKTLCTPALRGTILPGITRESIIDIARCQGFQVEERLVSVEEMCAAEEAFVTANAIGLLPVGSITYQGRRLSYGDGGFGAVSHQLHSTLKNIQMGLTEDNMGWTFVLE